MSAHLLRAAIGSTMAFTLTGCATYAPPRQSYAYFVVPCSTPGAFPAEPAIEVPRAGVSQAVPRDTPLSPQAGASPAPPPRACLIAAAVSRAGYARPYYGGSDYYGRYGYPFFGSIGIGVHGGGHGWGGYGGHGFGHGGGGHGGSHGGHGGH